MQKKYIFLTLLFLIMIFIVAFVRERNNCDSSISEQFNFKSKYCTQFTPKKLLVESLSSNRYISVDELATKIIAEDPSYVLIDIRSKEQFEKYTLPNAKNVPFETILDESKGEPYYKAGTYKKIIFSNSTLLSDQAWFIMRRNGCVNMKVLDGGLNKFFLTLMDPPKPSQTDPLALFDEYSFRKSAAVYFGMPNPLEFIPKQQLAVYKAKSKKYIVPKTRAHSKTDKHITPTKKIIKLEKKETSDESEEEEDEGC